MTINFDHLIEKFILGVLKGKKLKDFLSAMDNSPSLAYEVQFQSGIAEAITETDVLNLRASLKDVIAQNSEEDVNPIQHTNNLFDLSNNLNAAKVSNKAITEDEDVESSLQYIHLDNHQKALTERIHEVDEEVVLNKRSAKKAMNDDDLWKEVSTAIQEKDIIDLRSNLKEITRQGSTEITDFEIDQYLNEDLSPEFSSELDSLYNESSQFAQQVDLHKEIDKAVSEKDIINLRANLHSIVEDEQSIQFSEIKRIDDYLMNYLEDKGSTEFEEAFGTNNRLKHELDLNAEINEAVLEDDIMNLRNSMSEIIREDKQSAKVRQLIPDAFKKSPAKFIGAAASVAAVISVGALSLSQQKVSSSELYQKAYKPYEATGLYRSSANISPEIIGVDLYNNRDFNKALEHFQIVLAENPEHPMCNFYAGLSYQEMNKFNKAIESYQKVINEKDNLFIEQAEWYMALAYLKTDEKNKAYKTFNEIIDKKGYYSKDVKEIMKKLK